MTSIQWRGQTTAIVLATLLGSQPAMGAADSVPKPPPGPFSIRWTPGPSRTNTIRVEVLGVSRGALDKLRRANWKSAQWQELLSVYAEQGDLIADVGLPAMLGTYSIQSSLLRFEPQFPIEAGVNYRAVFRPDKLPAQNGPAGGPATAVYRAPARATNSTTVVTQIYPTAEVLPENLLKFYVHFSAPMSRGHIYEHIHLRDEAGREVELPFLEIDEELWNSEMTRLTLFIDPGRIKRGVQPLEEIGPALEAGKRYRLEIDREWRDGWGTPLKQSFQKVFQVGPPDRRALDPGDWKIEPPKSETREPLTITFPTPMDHALAQRVIRVSDRTDKPIAGAPGMGEQERRWSFIPARPWQRGRHTLRVQTTLEDLAGNNIGKPFEVDLFDGVQQRLTNSVINLPFEVR